jgi:hypothetical protein
MNARRLGVGHHVLVTTATPSSLPPDPEQYDAPRNVAARRRGLEQPYIAGGQDPELDETLRRERPYVRILVAMVVVIVMTGIVLGLVSAIVFGPGT